jgi:DNA polymerase III epsilon subunit family exonuclease
MQPATQHKVTLEQSARLPKLPDYFFSFHAYLSMLIVDACYNPEPMPPFANLVSDSTLVQETIDLLRVSGGRANALQIVDAVFKVSHIDEELAGLLVGDLLKDDRRFKIVDGNTIELLAHDCESRLLDELDYVVVDIEATGAKMPPNRIIELGAYRIRGRKIVDNFLTLVNPELSIPRFVMSLTGISNEMVKEAPLFAEVAPRWLEFVEDAVLIAHNAPFDTNFLNHEISRVYPGHRMMNTHLCTVTLSRRVVPGLANYRLETVAEHFSIPIFDRHRAGSDALATAETFLHLLDLLEEHGIRDLAAARQFQSPTPKPTDSGSGSQFLPLVSGF